MPTLYLLRHGKSDWSAGVGSDHDRPLKARGQRAARLAGRVLTAREEEPDLVLSSTAERARRTAELAREAGEWSAPLETDETLYAASVLDIVARLREVPAGVERVLVVGHEPSMSGVVAHLAGARVAYPTAALARIDLDASEWSGVDAGRGELAWLLPPRLVEDVLRRLD